MYKHAVLCVALVSLFGCAYPRHTTPIHAAAGLKVPSEETPANMYTFRLISATAPETKISGLGWDDDGSGPDLFVRLYVDDRMIWESPVIENNARPEWNTVLPRNVVIPENGEFRLELWDKDSAITADPVGQLTHRGLPTTALPDAIARLQLDTATTVVIMVSAPTPHIGVGLSVEVHPDQLKVLSVAPYSPAARAGIRTGDQIVGIANERVSQMDDGTKMSELSMAAQRHYKLVVADAQGKNERDTELKSEVLWEVM